MTTQTQWKMIDILKTQNGMDAYRCECGQYRSTPCGSKPCLAYVLVPKIAWEKFVEQERQKEGYQG